MLKALTELLMCKDECLFDNQFVLINSFTYLLGYSLFSSVMFVCVFDQLARFNEMSSSVQSYAVEFRPI